MADNRGDLQRTGNETKDRRDEITKKKARKEWATSPTANDETAEDTVATVARPSTQVVP